MANRQSLKELQERLARRLTAARSEVATASWLAVEAGGQRYLMPLVQSGEIFPWSTVQEVPYTKPWYVGVASLRGGLQGVIDLGALLHRSGSALAPVSERVSSDSRMVSLHTALGINAVLLIDRLLGLRNPAMFTAVDDRLQDAPPCFGHRLVDAQGQTWQELDLQALSTEPEFMAIAA
ncbi:chemotaxis protein CheW [Hydrogenophaga sp.]|uniref:chemotaxis protein CheW n=1 Tax=Hydrogenophaga sp. TaxID=1904254 RepID=UPI0025C385D3|nr:chemotaxis protein CheW [Hydrogenophaga sp.]